ncbi:uncharacterized protein LOC143281713 [Babylonia areolata]|uniref:uncharacterized protein LOC143281713 n=1 Tax=Babylonia areolata TaxID=304850 RepID=UPI003FD00315
MEVAGYFAMDKPKPHAPQSLRCNSDNTGNSTFHPSSSDDFRSKIPRSLSVPCQQQQQQYPPSYFNDYLTPTSPDSPNAPAQQPPQLPALPVGGFVRSNSQSPVATRGGNTGGREQFGRADSGIEADFRRGPSPSVGPAPPRSSTIYECIDGNHHYTDPSPTSLPPPSLRPPGGDTVSRSGVSIPSAVYRPTAASDTEDGPENDVRAGLHPAYNSLTESSPHEYAETCHCRAKSGGGPPGHLPSRHLRYLWCGLGVLTVIVVILLAIVAYVFVVLIPGMQAHIRDQEGDMRRMLTTYHNLSQRVDALQWPPASSRTTLESEEASSSVGAAEDVVVQIAALNDSVRQFGSQLQQLSVDLQFQMDNISRAPDLSGVRAETSLDACFYYNITSVQALPGPASTTSWLPHRDSQQLRDHVVMSVTCGVQGGTLHQAEARTLPSGERQHRCRCEGRVPDHTRRMCYIHLVLCPRVLSVSLATSSTAAHDQPPPS